MLTCDVVPQPEPQSPASGQHAIISARIQSPLIAAASIKIMSETKQYQNTHIQFRLAVDADAEAIAALVNSAYRGDSSRQGWTTEDDLLQGPRIHAQEVSDLLAANDSVILLCLQDQDIIGCVHLEKTESAAYLGMFVVRPVLQGNGIGKYFMQTAEQHAQKMWGISKIWMTVITVRHELIAYYERRGYVRTGRFKPFPADNGKEKVLVENLQFEEMEKTLPPA